MSGISSTSTFVTLLAAARGIDASTTDAALVKVDGIVNLRADQASMVKGHVVAYAVRSGRTTKSVADLLGIGGTAVRNLVKGVEAWEATGFSDAALALLDGKVSAWTLVTSSARWLNKWTTDEGTALMAAIAAAETDADKFTILTSGEVPQAEGKSPEAALIAALTRADNIVNGDGPVLSLDDEQRAIVLDLLASISAGVVVPASVPATV